MRQDIVIAAGFDRSHLLAAAAEIERYGRLDRCLAGIYPTRHLRQLLEATCLLKRPRFQRLLDRAVNLPDRRIRAHPFLEVAGHQGGRLLGPHGLLAARHGFGRAAKRYLRHANASLYHYRSGFGHGAISTAKNRRMVTLCDHSIVHPALLDHLVAHDGRMPAAGAHDRMRLVWRDVLRDIRQADAVLVNSDFVKMGFVHQGIDDAIIHVIYQGVDDAFLDLVRLPADPSPSFGPHTPLRLAFAGAFEQRKGAAHLVDALCRLDDFRWTLELIGPIDDAMHSRYRSFFADERVSTTGRVDRSVLARRLAAADIFLFPSLAEGSARVVFEALACGCYVITTPNSGSIVEHRVHGALVPPDQPLATVAALREADADRARLGVIKSKNRALIQARYRQKNYGDALIALYDRLLANRREGAA